MSRGYNYDELEQRVFWLDNGTIFGEHDTAKVKLPQIIRHIQEHAWLQVDVFDELHENCLVPQQEHRLHRGWSEQICLLHTWRRGSNLSNLQHRRGGGETKPETALEFPKKASYWFSKDRASRQWDKCNGSASFSSPAYKAYSSNNQKQPRVFRWRRDHQKHWPQAKTSHLYQWVCRDSPPQERRKLLPNFIQPSLTSPPPPMHRSSTTTHDGTPSWIRSGKSSK